MIRGQARSRDMPFIQIMYLGHALGQAIQNSWDKPLLEHDEQRAA